MMFLARPLRDQCSSVPKSAQQNRAKVAHGLLGLLALSPFAPDTTLSRAAAHADG
jgi:hypothetical protein